MSESSKTIAYLSQRAVEATVRGVLNRVDAGAHSISTILDEYSEPLLAFTGDRRILTANRAGERFFGYELRELDQRPTDELVPARLRQPDAPAMLATPDLMTVDIPSLRKDGSELPTSWTLGSSSQGAEPIFVMLVRNRVQLDDAIAALRESEERYRLLIEGVRDHAIYMLDAQGRVSTWNRGAALLKGWDDQEILGRPFATFFSDADQVRGGPQELLAEASQRGVVQNGWQIRKDRSTFYAESFVSPLFGNDGVLRGYAVVTHDLTARIRSEENERVQRVHRISLALSQAMTLEEVANVTLGKCFAEVEATGGAIYELSSDGDRLDLLGKIANTPPSVSSSIALAESSPLAMAARDLAPSFYENQTDENGAASSFAALPLSSRHGLAGAIVVYYASDKIFDDAARSLLVTMGELCSQAVARALALASEQRARAELQALNEQLLNADRTKDEFLATMSHELRTPLSAILGWATILNRKPRDEEVLNRGLEVIERNARAQGTLISDLLDVSRIISGKLRIKLQTVELAGLMRAAIDVTQPAATSKGVELILRVDPKCRDISADPDRFQQILWNLLVNAVRFTPRGGRVEVAAEQRENGVCITVDDTGCGIAPEHLPYIFDRFRQVDSSITRKHGGLGLGLAIVRHLTEAHGGSVRAESNGEDQGTKFSLLFPLQHTDDSGSVAAEEVDEASAGKTVARESEAPGKRLLGIRILVVDDEHDSLELATEVLEAEGAHVTAVSSARRALDVQGHFDVMVSDIGMPEMDGYVLIAKIRERSSAADLPAFALTAYASAQDVERAKRAGFQAHLPKPLDVGLLVETIERQVHRALTPVNLQSRTPH